VGAEFAWLRLSACENRGPREEHESAVMDWSLLTVSSDEEET
jgi:hypothetical protein